MNLALSTGELDLIVRALEAAAKREHDEAWIKRIMAPDESKASSALAEMYTGLREKVIRCSANGLEVT